jgi:hypothetical protein
MAKAEIRNVTSKILSDEWATLTQVRFELKRRDGIWEPQIRESYDRGHAAAENCFAGPSVPLAGALAG